LEEMLKKKEGSQPQVAAPFKVTNKSGYPIEISILKEEYLLTRECKLNKKELFLKEYKVAADSSLDIFDDFDSFLFTKSNPKMHMSFGTSLFFKVNHPEYPTWKSESLSLANQTSNNVTLINKNGLKHELLYLTRVKASSQEIFIGSTVEIINRIPEYEFSDHPLEILVKDRKKNAEFNFNLASGQNMFLPFDFVNGEMMIRYQNENLISSSIRFNLFKLQNNGYLIPFKDTRTNKNFAIRYERDFESFFQMKFILLPVFEIVNYLPFYIEIFLSNSILKKVIPLEPGVSFKTTEYTMLSKILSFYLF
jgi:hypothetical protein